MARFYTGSTEELDSNWAIKQGIIGGFIASITFAMAEMLGAALLGGGSPFMPLKMMASIPLGTPPPEIALGTAILVGTIFHLIFSAVVGVIFALIVVNVAALRTSPMALIVAATVYGAILWPLNFYLLAPLIGRPWFTETPPVQQFVYHAFFFGTVLGLYLMWALPNQRQRNKRTS